MPRTPSTTPKKILTTSLPLALVQRLDRVASAYQLNKNAILEQALAEFFARLDGQEGLQSEAPKEGKKNGARGAVNTDPKSDHDPVPFGERTVARAGSVAQGPHRNATR